MHLRDTQADSPESKPQVFPLTLAGLGKDLDLPQLPFLFVCGLIHSRGSEGKLQCQGHLSSEGAELPPVGEKTPQLIDRVQ